MSLERFWSILVKQWKFVVICFFIMSLGSYIGSKSLSPIYQSTALVQVALSSTTNPADVNSFLASDQLVQTEATLAVSDAVMQEVASHHKGMTAGEIAAETSSTVKNNTQVFEIDVQDPNPQRASELANDIAQTLIKQQFQQLQQGNQRSRQQLQQELDATQQQINDLTNQLAAREAQGAKRAQIDTLQVKLDASQQHYNQWEAALVQLELAEAQNSNFLRIVQIAAPNRSPVRPNVLLNTAAGSVTGLLLGILCALVYEQLDTRVHTAEAVAELLNWPILATIWRSASSHEDIIDPKQPASAEAYRILRTSIGFTNIDKPLGTVLVTSATKGDGKSTIAANIAIFMAKAGKHTLLVDADLHHPTQQKNFALAFNTMGLSNAVLAFSRRSLLPHTSHLASPPDFRFDPYIHATSIPNLGVMPAGSLPPNPSELLDSRAMERFSAALANCGAEIIIIDSPPLLGLSDARILASKVDGMLLVVDITRANKHILKQVKALLTQTGANVIGCVVNKQRRNRSDARYYYYSEERQQTDDTFNRQNGNIPAGAAPVQIAMAEQPALRQVYSPGGVPSTTPEDGVKQESMLYQQHPPYQR